jgi:hypothetical protein
MQWGVSLGVTNERRFLGIFVTIQKGNSLRRIKQGNRVRILAAAPGGRALALAEVALVVGDFLEGFGGLRFLLVEVAVEDCGENAGGVWECMVSL